MVTRLDVVPNMADPISLNVVCVTDQETATYPACVGVARV